MSEVDRPLLSGVGLVVVGLYLTSLILLAVTSTGQAAVIDLTDFSGSESVETFSGAIVGEDQIDCFAETCGRVLHAMYDGLARAVARRHHQRPRRIVEQECVQRRGGQHQAH